MIRLMIVDDEAGIRNGLRNCIEWDIWDIRIVGEAEDGESAWRLALETQPDIVLTDIRMPQMDGIELARRLRRRFPAIRIILLTGFDDTKYLKAALEIGVKAYLVKPAGAEETIDAVLRQKNEILQDQMRREFNLRRDTLLEENLSILQMHFINSLINRSLSSPRQIRGKAESLDIPLGGPFYRVLLLYGNPAERHVLRPQYEQDVERWHIIQSINELKETVPGLFYCDLDMHEFFFLMNLDDPEDSGTLLPRLCDRFQNLFRQPEYQPLIGIGETVDRVERISDSYLSARMGIGRAVWNREKHIFHGPDRSQQIHFFRQPPDAHHIERDITLMITQARFIEAGIELRRLFSCYYDAYADFDLLREACKRIMMYIGASLSGSGVPDHKRFWVSIDHALTADELLSFMLSRISDNPGATLGQNHSKLISKVTHYMEAHYAENITLQNLAKEVFLSPGHLSLIFRKETGVKINDWLNCFRIEQAKLLLARENCPITEIAERVGFSSYKYFSMLFLKYANMSARCYRNRMLTGTETDKTTD